MAAMNVICLDKSKKFFMPKKSCLCSAYFDDSCFKQKPVSLKDATEEPTELKKRLIKGLVPTTHHK